MTPPDTEAPAMPAVPPTQRDETDLGTMVAPTSHKPGPMADLVTATFQRPERVRSFDPASWDLLIRQARRANLLARLAWLLKSRDLWDAVLPAARPHLESAWAFSQRQRIAVQWEIECIGRAIQSTGVPQILLKGAAYVALDLPTSAGRLVSDVDILVPKDQIIQVESALMIHGWHTIHHGAYDQRYYRQWMHEIPPMRHLMRGTVIDVHHALLPETARIKVDSDGMRMAAMPVPDREGVFVLSPCDMVLHSAAHLFHEGELDNGLRDLVDLDGLLRHFGEQPGFWERLVPRASEVGLVRPLFYALRYTARILGTPVPSGVIGATVQGGPMGPLRSLMDFLFLRALRPNHASCSDTWTLLVRWMLYVRSHWLRMPLPLLIYHLGRKAVTREENDPSKVREQSVPADRPPLLRDQ